MGLQEAHCVRVSEQEGLLDRLVAAALGFITPGHIACGDHLVFLALDGNEAGHGVAALVVPHINEVLEHLGGIQLRHRFQVFDLEALDQLALLGG